MGDALASDAMEGALALVDDWPVGTVAVGVRGPDGTVWGRGPVDTPFVLASVTKALFAHTVLVALEEGTLALDAPAGPPGATVRHLLAHASGLAPDGDTVLAPPGERRIYSNAGFETLGHALAAASGLPVNVYAREATLEPLGLTATVLEGSPAHGARSTVTDLLRFAAEWLEPTLLAPATVADATREQFPGLAGVLPGFGTHDPNPWGLGVELRGTKRPHWTGRRNAPATFGHFGRAGTCWWVDPVHRVALVALTDREFGPWAAAAWPALADAVLDRLAG
jgi:CubicO group peptidase (beta-lactamase class C family)